MQSTKNIYVHSTSEIKRAAVEKWLGFYDQKDVQVFFTKSEDTECPQPLGKDSAIQCLFKRLPQKLLDLATYAQLHIGIENFIYQCKSNGVWYDRVAVAATYVAPDDTFMFFATIGIVENLIPSEYAPVDAPDITRPLGYRVTVGERISSALPHVLHDNWATAVDSENIDRVDQIFSALCCLQKKFTIL
jgi:hypothetical protein